MSIKVEASRFAVLNVDDEDSGIKKKQKPSVNNQNNKKQKDTKQPKNNGSQTSNSNYQALSKSNPQKAKKTPIQSNVLNNFSQINSQNQNNDQVLSSSKKKVDTMKNQWDQWKEIDEKFVEKEFQDQLKRVVEESKKNKINAIDKQSTNESNSSNKKNIKKTMKDEIRLVEDKTSVILGNVVQQQLPKAKKDKCKNLEQLDDALTNLSFEDQLEIKNQSILEIKKIIENIQSEIGDFKSKNQKLCKYLLEGEGRNLSDMELEISDLREKHKLQTLRLSQLSTDLEKERSKGHVLKSELNKIKTHKEASSK